MIKCKKIERPPGGHTRDLVFLRAAGGGGGGGVAFPNQKHPAAPVYHPSLEVKFRSRALAGWICRRAPRRNFWLGARTPLLWELATRERESAWCLRSRRLIESVCVCAPGCVTLPFNYSIFSTGSSTAWLNLLRRAAVDNENRTAANAIIDFPQILKLRFCRNLKNSWCIINIITFIHSSIIAWIYLRFVIDCVAKFNNLYLWLIYQKLLHSTYF